MNLSKVLTLFFVISVLMLGFNCEKDDDITGISRSNFFVYGLLGIEPDFSNPDSSHYWVYARVFGHPDYQNVEAEY